MGALTVDKLTDVFDLFNNPVGFEGTVADAVMAAGEKFSQSANCLNAHQRREREQLCATGKMKVETARFVVSVGHAVCGHRTAQLSRCLQLKKNPMTAINLSN